MKASDRYSNSLRDVRNIDGLYRGRVEDNRDPLKLGRVRVRVPMIHGIKPPNGVSTKGLPWATMISRSAGYNFGSFIVPEVGEYVFIMFEDKNRDKPVYFGSSFGTKTTIAKQYGPDDGGKWKGVKGKNEVPIEAQRKIPSVKMVYKTRRGSKILFDTNPKSEKIVIQDEKGQGMVIDTTSGKVIIQSTGIGIIIDGDAIHLGNGSHGISYGISQGKLKLNNGHGEVNLNPDGSVTIDSDNVNISAQSTTISSVNTTIVETNPTPSGNTDDDTPI